MHQKPLGGWALPGPAGESLSTPPPLATVKGLGPRRGGGKERKRKRRGRENGSVPPPLQSYFHHCP